MVQIGAITICLASFLFLNVANCANNDLRSHIANVEFTAVRNLTQFLRDNPNVKLLQKLTKETDPKFGIVYRLGNRITGDRLVAQTSASQQWQAAQDVKLTLTYPRTGTGAIVSYVQSNVDQSSSVGRGYVISGGIGQRTIQIIIEAQGVLYFRHTTQIYGY